MADPIRAWAVVLPDDDTWGFFCTRGAADTAADFLDEDQKPARLVELVEVVRCRECIRASYSMRRAEFVCALNGSLHGPEHYCASARPREERDHE